MGIVPKLLATNQPSAAHHKLNAVCCILMRKKKTRGWSKDQKYTPPKNVIQIPWVYPKQLEDFVMGNAMLIAVTSCQFDSYILAGVLDAVTCKTLFESLIRKYTVTTLLQGL